MSERPVVILQPAPQRADRIFTPSARAELADAFEVCDLEGDPDPTSFDAVLPEAGLADVSVVEPWLAVPDPKRAILDQAILDAGSIRVDVVNA